METTLMLITKLLLVFTQLALRMNIANLRTLAVMTALLMKGSRVVNEMNTKNLLDNFFSSLALNPYTKLFFVGDGANWVLDWEIRNIQRIAVHIGIVTYCATRGLGLIRQSIFHSSRSILQRPYLYVNGLNNVAFSYFHGYPSSGDSVAIECYENLKKYHRKVTRIQVSHSYMKNVILDTGIAAEKVFLIPIAIDPNFFSPQSAESKKNARNQYGIPQNAVVVGSFQKDGNGWREGLEPKLIKGPDVFLKTVQLLKIAIPELFILISGPARGYVKKGLGELKIPYKHIYLDHYPDIGKLYHCLDLYVVASREEGGPKAILEAMASGVPLVTTRVGQAMDLVTHEENALMVDPEDTEGLAYWGEKILSDSMWRERVIRKGIATAGENTYASQVPLWREFFKDFVRVNH